MTKQIIKFERQNCNPCETVSNFLGDSEVEYISIDVEKNPKKAIEFKVMSTPMTFLVDGEFYSDKKFEGEILKSSRGFDAEELEEMIELL